MKVLLCGTQDSAFLKNLISRLHKERHEIFVLTGNKNHKEPKVKGVFQKYSFVYTDMGVSNVIANVCPDVIVFMGSMDKNFGQEMDKGEVINYISGLTNIILSAKSAGVKKFVYLSSLSIFSGSEEVKIDFDTEPAPVTEREEAISQGEEICKFYRSDRFDVCILRMSHVYGGFEDDLMDESVMEPLVQMVKKQNKITCDGSKVYFLTYISDAVEAVCRVVGRNSMDVQEGVVTGENLEEETVIRKIAGIYGKHVQLDVINEDKPQKYYCFEEMDAYGIRLKYKFKDGLLQYMKKKHASKDEEKQQEETTKKYKLLLEKCRPVIETCVLAFVAYFLELFGERSSMFGAIDFYMIYVALIAAVHGTNCGLVALMLSVMSKFIFGLSGGGLQTLVVDYTQYLWVLQLLTVGVLVGFMRDKYLRKTQDLTDELKHYQMELDNMEKINESNVYVKDAYEKRLINYKNSLARIYEITSQLDLLDPRKVTFKTVEVIKEVMECEEVSIFRRSGKGPFFRIVASSTDKYKNMGKSFCYEDKFPLYEMLEEEGIFRNRTLDEKLPVFASAIKDAHGTQTIMMIWSLDLANINQYQINMFRVLTRLIEKSLSRANKYMENIYKDAYYPDSRVMKQEALAEILETYREGRNKEMLDYALLQVERTTQEEEEWIAYLKTVQKQMRETDIVGVNEASEGQIILPASNAEDAQFVIKRLAEKGITVTLVD